MANTDNQSYKLKLTFIFWHVITLLLANMKCVATAVNIVSLYMNVGLSMQLAWWAFSAFCCFFCGNKN